MPKRCGAVVAQIGRLKARETERGKKSWPDLPSDREAVLLFFDGATPRICNYRRGAFRSPLMLHFWPPLQAEGRVTGPYVYRVYEAGN